MSKICQKKLKIKTASVLIPVLVMVIAKNEAESSSRILHGTAPGAYFV